MIRLVIADDQPLIREGLKYIIEQDKDIEVAGCASDGKQAFELCHSLLPDVVLMDIVMPGCDGVTGTQMIKESFPNIKIIILTTFQDSENISKVLDVGADGYLLKDIESEKLIYSIKSVLKGLKIMNDEVFDHYISCIKAPKESMKEKLSCQLSQREISIIKLIVFGKSNKEISAELIMTEGSVRNMISGILSKLKLQDRTQLAVYSIKNRIV